MSERSLYLIAFFLLLSSGLVILRIIVRREYRQRGRLAPFPAALQALIFFAYGGFPALYLSKDWPTVSLNQFQHGLGLLLLFGGLAFLLLGMVHLGILRSIGQGQAELQQAGLYRRTRNPQALACGCYVLGFTLLWPSNYAIGWALLYVVLIHAMVLTEEEYLRRIYAHKYAAYCQQVPRYFGWGPRIKNASA